MAIIFEHSFPPLKMSFVYGQIVHFITDMKPWDYYSTVGTTFIYLWLKPYGFLGGVSNDYEDLSSQNLLDTFDLI